MKSYAYYNGNFAPYTDIRIPLSDRSIYFADAVYDAIIGREGKIFLFDEHMERLSANAKRLGLEAPRAEDIFEIIKVLIKKSCLTEYFIYVQLSRNAEERRHEYRDGDKTNILVTVRDFRLAPINKRISLVTTPDVRYMMCDVKTVNLLPSVIASRKAHESGACEAVFHRGERITECAHSNISIIKNGILYTHPLDRCILPGITRRHLLCQAKNLGIPVIERPFTKSELYSADEVIVSSTSKLCALAESVDTKSYEVKENSLGESLIYAVRKEFFDFIGTN